MSINRIEFSKKSFKSLFILAMSCMLFSCRSEKADSLLIYCGAGMKKPAEELASLFKKKYGIAINYNFAGSGSLLSQILLTRKGDLYIPAAEYYCDLALNKELIRKSKSLVFHTPAIVVKKGNPKNITALHDLGKPGLKVAWGNPESCAIGNLGMKILEKNRIREAVTENVITWGAPVNELLLYVELGLADTALIWEDLAKSSRSELETVEIAKACNIVKTIPAVILTCTRNRKAAETFLGFLLSAEGMAIFKKWGFEPCVNPEKEIAVNIGKFDKALQ